MTRITVDQSKIKKAYTFQMTNNPYLSEADQDLYTDF